MWAASGSPKASASRATEERWVSCRSWLGSPTSMPTEMASAPRRSASSTVAVGVSSVGWNGEYEVALTISEMPSALYSGENTRAAIPFWRVIASGWPAATDATADSTSTKPGRTPRAMAWSRVIARRRPDPSLNRRPKRIALPRYMSSLPFPVCCHATCSGAPLVGKLVDLALLGQGGDQIFDLAQVADQRFGRRRQVASADRSADLAVLRQAVFHPSFVVVRDVVSDPVYLLLDNLIEADDPPVPSTFHDPLVEAAIRVEGMGHQILRHPLREVGEEAR